MEQHIPFFSKMRSGTDAMIKDLAIARAGANYWVLWDICQKVRRRLDRPDKLGQWVEKEAERYSGVASENWAKSVDEVIKLTRKYGRP